ncbi:MAG: glutaredoxin family protein [Agromyces sp.]
MPSELTLIGRPGCHLCDDAREIVTSVAAAFPTLVVTERSIDDDAELRAKYADEIPVVLINGRMHAYWRVDPDRLRSALELG